MIGLVAFRAIPTNSFLRQAGAAGAVAEAVSEFQPDVGWSFNRNQCVLVAERAADCIGVIHRDHGRAVAENIAREALAAAHAVAE